MLSIISPLYKKDYATVRTICNISNACKHLNIGCTSLIHFWIGTVDSMVNMQQFMKATSFACCGFSFYDRVCNSILVYEYGNRPF